MRLRRAVLADAPALMRVKAALPMPTEAGVSHGGFLLGTSRAAYERFIRRDLVWLLEQPKIGILGFAVVLGWDTLRQSAIWQKRDAVKRPEGGPAVTLPERTAYFEQLAVLPEARVYGWYLAYRATLEAFQTHDGLLTTTVREPVTNRAVKPYLSAAGFLCVGEITEYYPLIGEISSDVHFLPKAVFLARSTTFPLRDGLARAERCGWARDALAAETPR